MTSEPNDRDEVQTLRAEREALTRRLGDSEERLRLLYDHAPFPVSVVSVTDGKYVYVNRAHCEFYQRPAEYYFDTDPYQVWVEVTLPEEFEHERALFQRVADGQIDSYTLAKRFRLPGGDTVPGVLHLSVSRDGAGRLHQLVGVTRDLRELRRLEQQKRELEQQLERSQKLEVVGRMAGGVAHDFNNRLLIVMGYADLLKERLQDPQALGFVEMIASSAERSAQLTRQLLAFSRRQVLSPARVDLAEVLERMRSMLQSVLDESVQLALRPNARGCMFCDPGQLEQVILNLAINARDAMPGGGRLTFATRDVPAGSDELPASLRSGDFVALEVTDTGDGISDDVLPHIFEPFFTTKPVGSGTGLGLSTVDGIVRQSGGHVAVSTRPGEGTTFTVFMPVSTGAGRETVMQPMEPNVESRAGRLGTVLICDDDEDVRKLIGDVMAIGAYASLVAAGAEQALALADACPKLDLVVTDIVMPGHSGPELVRRLRERHPGVAVLYVSGFADAASLASIEGEAFMSKPFRPAALLTRVRSLLDAVEPPASA